MRLFALLLAAALALPSPAIAATKVPDDPVAVLPFKNLNEDPELDWLRAGIAETMVTDLRKSGKVRVVERDQLDRALGEVLLQQKSGASDEQTATKVGKLVGAKTIVVGSFQKAGQEMRINARFVTVETGIILDTAKTTGSVTKVFALQDQVVDKLLGTPPPTRPKRKDSQKTFDAYRLYAMALTVASDADKVGYLKKSLELDPDFVYAADDLAELEKRLGGYMAERQRASTIQDAVFWTRLSDSSLSPSDRTIAANQFLTSRLNEHACRTLAEDAKRIIAVDIPAPPTPMDSATASSLFFLVMAYHCLHQDDLMLQAGEQYLKRFPTGVYFSSIDQIVRSVIDTHKRQVEARELIAQRYADIEEERAKTLADKRMRPDVAHARVVNLDLQRCYVPMRNDLGIYPLAVDECLAFEKKHADDPTAAGDLIQARYERIEALGELGRWEEAIPLAREFVAAHPTTGANPDTAQSMAQQIALLLKSSWPKDVVP